MKIFLKLYDTRKINVKFGNKNSLHLLTDLLPSDNYEDIAECIKILLRNGCDPNMPNEKNRTPFFTLLRIQPKLQYKNDLVDFFVENSNVDLYTYKPADMKRMFEKQNPHLKLPEEVKKTVDFDYMMSLLRKANSDEFDVNFPLFKENSKKKTENDENQANAFTEDCAKFLHAAVEGDLDCVVDLLISEGVDVNKTPQDVKDLKPAAFRAAARGYFRILGFILDAKPEPATVFKSKNLLHEVCHHFGMDPSKNSNVNYQKCFDLVLNKCDVNQKDEQSCTPLHYAVRYRNDVAVKALLEKSSYIGTKNIFGETPMDEVNRDVLEEFLDDCVTTNVRRTGDEEMKISISYNFLMAPKPSKMDSEFRQEIAPLQNIADNPELRPLILHPVLSSFLYLKWSKLSPLFYGNLVMFSIFMVSLIVYIVLSQSIPAEERNGNGWYGFFYALSMIGLVFLMIRELLQCILSFTQYIKSPVNWFEIALIVMGWIILLQSNETVAADKAHYRILRAVTILLAAYEFLQLVGTLPILSVSTHMVILKRVSITFLKSIGLYSIVLLAFALSFYVLFGGKHEEEMEEKAAAANGTGSNGADKAEEPDTFNSFAYPGIAIIKTFVMLTGEFDASSLNLDSNGASYCIIFLLFVFLVTIVLFNLLNALAVDDTHVSCYKNHGQPVLDTFCCRSSSKKVN